MYYVENHLHTLYQYFAQETYVLRTAKDTEKKLFLLYLAMGFDKAEELLPVFVVCESVVEDSVDFMTPKSRKFIEVGRKKLEERSRSRSPSIPDELIGVPEVRIGHEPYPPDNPGKVPEVEHVVALGRGGQEGGK